MNVRRVATTCPLCCADRSTPLVRAADPLSGACFQVVTCGSCGLAYTNPRPHPDDISRFYPAEYGPHKQPISRRASRSPLLTLLDTRPGRLLDFGCGSGALLRQAHAVGWRVTGIDASSRMVRSIREQLGLRAFEGSLPHPMLSPRSF